MRGVDVGGGCRCTLFSFLSLGLFGLHTYYIHRWKGWLLDDAGEYTMCT